MLIDFCIMETLANQSSEDKIRLDLVGHYFEKSFVQQLIAEMKTKSILVELGMDHYTRAEYLAMALLMDSALLVQETK